MIGVLKRLSGFGYVILSPILVDMNAANTFLSVNFWAILLRVSLEAKDSS
jgi:hypothetical protein